METSGVGNDRPILETAFVPQEIDLGRGVESLLVDDSDYHALAQFRFVIRQFLSTSERMARDEGLNPQQHQCLLAIAGRPSGPEPTIAYIAGRLLIEHHSAVGLVDRLVDAGLVERRHGDTDRRQVHVHLTERAREILRRLSFGHREELRIMAPRLIEALQMVIEDV